MTYAFYPGCSLEGTARAYGMSFREIARVLELDMPELNDWNCCGSTAFQTLDEVSYLSLSGRNMALAEKGGSKHIVTPCAACFAVLQKAKHHLAHDPEAKRKVNAALGKSGLSYRGDVGVRHLLDVLVNDVGLDVISARVSQPLHGLKVACYYGCLLTRPPAITGWDHPEYPMDMDKLIAALGAQPMDWSYKTECCGASMVISRPEMVAKLTDRILGNARDVGAEMVVTACPLCQSNLDMNREESEGEPLPIVYFTELIGLAFGLSPKALGLTKHLRDPAPALRRHGLAA